MPSLEAYPLTIHKIDTSLIGLAFPKKKTYSGGRGHWRIMPPKGGISTNNPQYG